jgi:release factor glutamine methyltransferase
VIFAPDVCDYSGTAAAVRAAATVLASAGIENARLEAELLMAEAAAVRREKLLAGSIALSPALLRRYQALVARRAAREPLAYITGRKEFYSLEFGVSSAVMIPRPETEALVAAALRLVSNRAAPTLLDLGTGSGAIAVALAYYARNLKVVATDISEPALAVARANAVRHGVASRIEFLSGDCWEALTPSRRWDRFDTVVSNPPYIPDDQLDTLEPEVRKFEPALALSGGSDGLDFYRRIANAIGEYLCPDGNLLVELGEGQAPAVASIMQDAGALATRTFSDLSGTPRVLQASFKAQPL